LLAAGLVLKIIQVFSKHQVTRNLWKKLSNPPLWIGILGLLWFLLRYELAPIFSARWWTLLLTLIFLIWFGFSLKYLIFNFKSQKQELDRELLNRRYIPGSKK
jgi:ABC-type sugar transport system permease subunit